MSLADFKKVAYKEVNIPTMFDANDESINIVIKPLTAEKCIDIIHDYNIFVEELIFNKIDFERLDEVEYVTRFGMEKFDEAVSFCIAVACDEPDFCDVVQSDMPWYKKVECFNAIYDLSLPDDKKKAQEQMEKIIEVLGTPIIQMIKGCRTEEESNSKENN